MYTRPATLGRMSRKPFRSNRSSVYRSYVPLVNRTRPLADGLTLPVSETVYAAGRPLQTTAWGRMWRRAQGLSGYEGDGGTDINTQALTSAQLDAQTNIDWDQATKTIPVISGNQVIPTNEYVPLTIPKRPSKIPVKYIALGLGGIALYWFLVKKGR